MNQALVDQIASAVLYEGYILYPYRPSVKNRQRWTFGGLVPRAYSQAQGETEPWEMQTECLVMGGPGTALTVSVRFLAARGPAGRQVRRAPGRVAGRGSRSVPDRRMLRVGDEVFYTWQEAVEQTIDLGESSLAAWPLEPLRREFVLEAAARSAAAPGPGGDVRGGPRPRAPARRGRRRARCRRGRSPGCFG